MMIGNRMFANRAGRWLMAIALTQLPVLSQTAESDATVELRGRVTTWTGKPIAGAAVAFLPPEQITTAELLATPPGQTDAEGRFAIQIPAVTPSEGPDSRLIVASRGMAARELWLTSLPPGKTRGVGTQALVRTSPDVGDIRLIKGVRLFGRIRDLDGRPVAGVEVVATDILDGNKWLRGSPLNCVCRARSNDSGIFELPAALPNAVRLTIANPGYLRQEIAPVAAGTPLEITLRPGGTIQGRVLDENGGGVAGAKVSPSYERRGPVTEARTAADGSFTLPLEYAGRYRLRIDSYELPDLGSDAESRDLSGHSSVLEGSQANLELVVTKAADKAKNEVETFDVRAVLADSGAPIKDFRAVISWHQFALNNNNYLEFLFARQLPSSKPSRDGVLQLRAPTNNATTGIMRVVAKGFAPATQRDVVWEKPEGESSEPFEVVVEMVPQATASGVVVDDQTGQPLAGAKVWVTRRPEVSQGIYNQNLAPPPDAATTAADGRFLVTELGEGKWQAHLQVANRPPVPPTDFELQPAEQLEGLTVKVPAGSSVQGHITGMEITEGSAAILYRLPQLNLGSNSGIAQIRPTGVEEHPLAADGAFRFDHLALGNYVLSMTLPTKPRCGPAITLPIEPLRLRAKGIDREFDASEDVPGQISGSIRFPEASVPFDQLVVIARQITDRNGTALAVGRNNYNGPRSFVGPDGRFSISASKGRYLLVLLDLGTNLVLANTTEPIASHGSADCEISVPMAQVRVRLEPEVPDAEMAQVDRIEVRLQLGDDNQAAKLLNTSMNRDQGAGVAVPPGATEVTLVLPEGNAVLLARSNVTRLELGNNIYNQPPLGDRELEIDPQAEPTSECTLPVVEPPAVSTDEGTDNQGLPAADK